MATKNDITGDTLIVKATTDAYRDGWASIFGNKDGDNKEPSESETSGSGSIEEVEGMAK